MYNAELKEKECFKTVLTNFEKGYLSKTVNGKVLDINDAIFAKPKKLVLCGESIQNGTPAPDAPAEIESISGKNLLNNNDASGTATWLVNETGGLFSATEAWQQVYWNIKLVVGEKYTFSYKERNSNNIYVYINSYTDETYTTRKSRLVVDGTALQYTFIADSSYVRIIFSNSDVVTDVEIPQIMLERRANKSEYVPYGHIRVKSTGKNLCKLIAQNKTVSGVTFSSNENVLNVSGTSTANTGFVKIAENLNISKGDYVVKFIGLTGMRGTFEIRNAQGTLLTYFSVGISTGDEKEIKIKDKDISYIQCYINGSGITVNAEIKIQLEKGTVATEYEEYKEDIVTIPLLHELRSLPNGVYDKIYKKDGKWYDEKKVGIVEYDGTEEWTWYEYYSCFYRNENGEGNSKVNMKAPANDDITNLLCNRYKGDTRNNLSANIINNIIANNMCNTHGQVCIRDTRFNNVANFKSELANNNLEVQYELSEPIITEITDEATIQALNQFELLSGVNYITSDAVINLEYFGGTPFEHQKLEAKLYD